MPWEEKTASKVSVNLASRSRRRNLTCPMRLVEVDEQVPSLLTHPYPGRGRGHPEDVDLPGAKLDHNQHGQAVE
jgi:hypothetical protein